MILNSRSYSFLCSFHLLATGLGALSTGPDLSLALPWCRMKQWALVGGRTKLPLLQKVSENKDTATASCVGRGTGDWSGFAHFWGHSHPPVLQMLCSHYRLAFTHKQNLTPTLTGPGLLVTGERSAAFCFLSASITWVKLDKGLFLSCKVFLQARSDM